MFFYQNTLVSPASPDAYAHRLVTQTTPETQRRVFNNICVYLNRYGWLRPNREVDNDIQVDGNLHWCSDPSVEPPADFLEKVTNDPRSVANKPNYPSGWEANSIVADPKFVEGFDPKPASTNDYRLGDSSPGIEAGIVLPAEWEDPFRPENGEKPDIGALPLGSALFSAGRNPSQIESSLP